LAQPGQVGEGKPPYEKPCTGFSDEAAQLKMPTQKSDLAARCCRIRRHRTSSAVALAAKYRN
jgi:hypothetical protein